MAEPTQQEMNEFVRVVDNFMQRFAEFSSSTTQTRIYATNDPVLIRDYESQLTKSQTLKSNIDNVVGYWNRFKATYADITAKTSMIIGDWIDEMRSWFGGGPQADLQGLSALPAVAWLTGIIVAGALAYTSMGAIMIRLDAWKIQRDDPTVPYDKAIAKARTADAVGDLFSFKNIPLFLGAGLALWLLMRN